MHIRKLTNQTKTILCQRQASSISYLSSQHCFRSPDGSQGCWCTLLPIKDLRTAPCTEHRRKEMEQRLRSELGCLRGCAGCLLSGSLASRKGDRGLCGEQTRHTQPFRHLALCIQRWSKKNKKDMEGELGCGSVQGPVPDLCEVPGFTSTPENRSHRIAQDLAQPPRALSLHHVVSNVFCWFCLAEGVNRSCNFKFYFHLCVYVSAYLSVCAPCLCRCSRRPEDGCQSP